MPIRSHRIVAVLKLFALAALPLRLLWGGHHKRWRQAATVLILLALMTVAGLSADRQEASAWFGCGGPFGELFARDGDDHHEQNDTMAEAVPVPVPFYHTDHNLWSCWIGGYHGGFDHDWFKFELTKGTTVQIDVWFADADGNIDVDLHGPDGATVAFSRRVDIDNEKINYTAPVSGTYYVDIYPGGAFNFHYKGNRYRFAITGCLEDAAVNNFENNDTRLTSYGVSANFEQSGLQSCPSNQDWYNFYVPAKSIVRVDAFFSDAEGDINLRLYDPDGVEVGIPGDTTTDNEKINYTVLTAGTYYVWVNLFGEAGAEPGNGYTLRIKSCAEDSYENHDSRLDASGVTLPFHKSGLGSCLGDEDWYSFTLAAGETVQIDAYFNHDDGNINTGLFRPDGTQVGWGTSGDNNEDIDYTVPTGAGGTYYVKVNLNSDAGDPGNTYALWIRTTSVSCTEDQYEPNDSLGEASEVAGTFEQGGQSGLKSCTGDQDWYKFQVTAAKSPVAIGAWFSHAEGDINIRLTDHTGAQVPGGAGDSTTDNETIDYIIPSAGTYYVRVNLLGDAGGTPGNAYTLRIWTCSDDSQENNDTWGTATAAPLPFKGNGLRSCLGDEDWYGFPLAAGETVQIDATFTHIDGNIDVRLTDDTGAQVPGAYGKTTTNNEGFEYTVPTGEGGDYYVKVALVADDATPGVDYTLEIDAAAPCGDDNDGIAANIDGTYNKTTSQFTSNACDFSNDFTDQHITGGNTTFGSFVSRGNNPNFVVNVTDAANPAEGVDMVAKVLDPQGDLTNFYTAISVCGQNTALVFNHEGQTRTKHCTGEIEQVSGGPIIAAFGYFWTEVPAGVTISVDELGPGTYELSNLPGSAASITVAGVVLAPGESVVLAPLDVFACFSTPTPFDPLDVVAVETQFLVDPAVAVGIGQYVCSPAIKDGPGVPPPDPSFRCFEAAGTVETQISIRFDTEFGQLRSKGDHGIDMLCVPLEKNLIGPGPPEPFYACSDFSEPQTVSAPPISLGTQFGAEPNVPLSVAEWWCVPAQKNGAGDLNLYPPLVCISASGTLTPSAIDLFTQFGPEPLVDLAGLDIVCVPATKTVLGSDGVGGIAELPEVAGTPLEAAGSSGPSPGLLAGVAAIAAGTVTLGGAAWYARRRR